MSENIIEKWAGCRHSLTFSFDAEDVVHEYADRGYNMNYCCEKKEVVDSQRFPVTELLENSQWQKVAKFCDLGRADDPQVLTALTLACGNCPHYQPKDCH